MRLIFTLIFLCCVHFLMAQNLTYPKGVEDALAQAGGNRSALEKVMQHFRTDNFKDSMHYKVASFLIANLPGHTSVENSTGGDAGIINLLKVADSIYYSIVKNKSLDFLTSNALADSLVRANKYIRCIVDTTHFNERGRDNNLPAVEHLSTDFLIQQIDHAFWLRQNSFFVRQLTFADFCENTVGIQKVRGRNVRKSGKELYGFFSKYLPNVTQSNMSEVIQYYNVTIDNFRKLLGRYPMNSKMGFEEFFFNEIPDFDCFDITSFDSRVLNAMGIPTTVNYNIAYKMLQGKHSSCAIPTQFGHYAMFASGNLERVPEIMDTPYEKYDGWMNLYTLNYAVQQANPYSLKNDNETIPENLSSPFIKDETAIRIQTTSLTLPFKKKTNNKLAYLATFNSGATDILPVTWGIINSKKNKVLFENVIPGRLYFPVYYDENDGLSPFGDHFILGIDSTNLNKRIVRKFLSKANETNRIDAVVTRKFPRKDKMIALAKKLIGTVVLASNNAKFTPCDTLYTLDFEPQPYLQDIVLNNTKPYKFYKVEAPRTNFSFTIAEIQFLTKKLYNYNNVIKPGPLPIFKSADINSMDTTLVRLIETDYDTRKNYPEYDGKMGTAPSAYPSVTIGLASPQVITHIRFAPLNADNGITPGDSYQLLNFELNEWKEIETKVAEYNYLFFPKMYKNKLYWLKNLSRGKEEFPFIFDSKGNQKFIYTDVK
jgi:hypothetical protein